jgi:hypothetical protein
MNGHLCAQWEGLKQHEHDLGGAIVWENGAWPNLAAMSWFALPAKSSMWAVRKCSPP